MLDNVDFANISKSSPYGFCGFITVSALRQSDCREVPDEPGVYLVLWPWKDTDPKFLEPGIGGYFKGKNPNVCKDELENHWVKGTRVVYIGKAGGVTGKATLKSRLRQYVKFGCGRRISHWGGQYIWQLANADQLQVCWRKSVPHETPREIERALTQEFKGRYCKLPFANLQL